jgi:hypothetical protein
MSGFPFIFIKIRNMKIEKGRYIMGKDSYLEVYKELSTTEGITTLFRKFEDKVWIMQYKGDKQIGVVLVENEDIDYIHNAKPIKNGDGITPQE